MTATEKDSICCVDLKNIFLFQNQRLSTEQNIKHTFCQRGYVAILLATRFGSSGGGKNKREEGRTENRTTDGFNRILVAD